MSSASTSQAIKVAVLDDYQNLFHEFKATETLGDTQSKLDITVYRDTITGQALVDRLQPYEVICTMRERTPFPADLVKQLPNLKILVTTAMRNRGLDLEAFAERGIPVYGTQGEKLPPPSVTVQHTWALILALASNIPRDDRLTKTGGWLTETPLNTVLGGKVFGTLGLGKLGAATAKIAILGFGMTVIAWSENLTQEKADEAAESDGLPSGSYKAVSKEELFRTSDVLSVHLILSDRTRDLVNQAELNLLKPTALLINTSRGPIINEKALLAHLIQGKIRGAALDVFDVEPLPLDSPWRSTGWGKDGRSEVVLSPHSGYSYEETLRDMWKETAENLKRYALGEELVNRMGGGS